MRRVLSLAVLGLILAFNSFSGYAACDRKVFDPLEPIDKTIPPNILVVVDNSGSMSWDTRNLYLYDYRTDRYVWFGDYAPTTGDYYHYSLDLQNSYYTIPYVQPYERFAYSTEATETRISTSTYSQVGEISISDSAKVDFTGFAVDIWVPYEVYEDRTKAEISIMLEHEGVSAEIKPTNQWFAYRYSDGSASYYAYDTKKIGRTTYYRLRVQYAFKDFYGMDKAGNWKLYLKTDYTRYSLYYERFGLHFNIYVSKMTALKTVLQRIFEANPEVRFALGTYKVGNYNTYVWDADGLKNYSSYWYVTSYNPGLTVWEDWPEDELDTQGNRESILEWIDLKPVYEDEYVDGRRKEIFSRGYTPIYSLMNDVRSYLVYKYGQDPYEACRNYAVVYLTDGQCTESICGDGDDAAALEYANSLIRSTIEDIYRDHIVQVGTNNRGTKTYIIGLSLSESDREWLDDWADAGDDGDHTNNSATAYMPQNSEELMQAFADAIHSASAQEVVINSDVIFGTIDPDKAPAGSIFKASQFKTPAGNTYDGTYPAIEANIMFTTKIYYPSWEGNLVAYMPMYKNATDGKIYYFPQTYDSTTGTYKPDYPIIWDAKSILEKRLLGYQTDADHVPGIRDALGLTDVSTTGDDTIPWRDIYLVYPTGSYPSFAMLNLNSFVYDESAGKWVPSPALVNQVADIVYPGDSQGFAKAAKLITFVQARMLGDITYSSPATIYEPNMGFEDWRDSYLKFKIIARAQRTPVVTVGANDGMLHGFNIYTGKEVWAVIPWGVIDNLKRLVDNYDPANNPSGQIDITNQDILGRSEHIYGVASSPKIVDVGLLDDDNPDNDVWFTYLVCGLGGGGNSYFCLDVTDPLRPQIKWDTSTSSDFSDMGETWAYPAMWLSNNGDGYVNVGFFVSGYSTDLSKGKKLYVMDIYSGELITDKNLISGINDNFLFAAPAGILDSDARYIKGVYVGSTYGELFRYDYITDSVCKVFETNNNYAIITLPAVYVDPNNNEWVSLGELGCSDVYSGIFANNAVLYTIKAYPTTSCTGDKNLIDITSVINNTNFNTSIPLGGNDGYYYDLSLNETMFADPLITTYFYTDSDTGTIQFETVSVFVTYKYPSSGDACGLGESYLYIFGVTDLFVGTREDEQSSYGSMVSRGRSGSPVKTGVSGTVWINTPDGPLRILPLDDSAGSASIPVYTPFGCCMDAKKIGAGSWIVY